MSLRELFGGSTPKTDPKYRGLKIRKYADRAKGLADGTKRIPATLPDGRRAIVNPDTMDPNPWPLSHVEVENDGGPPQYVTIPSRYLQNARNEGWVHVENERVAVKPKGPEEEPYKEVHVFNHIDAFTINAKSGDIRYVVTRQPDKYDVNDQPTEVAGDPETYVVWDYQAELA